MMAKTKKAQKKPDLISLAQGGLMNIILGVDADEALAPLRKELKKQKGGK